jgi:thioredoxin 1
MMNNIINVVDQNTYMYFINNNKCIVKFTATWCGPCKIIAPLYKELSIKYKNIKFLEIDIDKADEISNYEYVQGVPFFLFYNHGIRQDNLTFSGANSKLLISNSKSLDCLINKLFSNNTLVYNNAIINDAIDNNN